MGWIIAKGTDGDGTRFIARIDGTYSNVAARRDRDAVVVVRVSGRRILEASEERAAFEDMLTASLAPFRGVYVASYSRAHPHESYTWLYYALSTVNPGDVPIPDDLTSLSHVAVARDPKWREYESLNPPRMKLWTRVRTWVEQFFMFRQRQPQLLDGHQHEADVAVLHAMRRDGADLSQETDVVFYLYFESRENAAGCARELWDQRFRAEVLMPPSDASDETAPGQWLVRARQEIVPELTAIRTAADVMKASAARYNGAYDGWEAMVVR